MLRIMQYFAFGNVAFGNEVALTDDFVIVGATRTSAFTLPITNRQSLGLLWRPRFLANR